MISDDSIFGKAGKENATPEQVADAVRVHSLYEPSRMLSEAAANYSGIHPQALYQAVKAGRVSYRGDGTGEGIYRLTEHVRDDDRDGWRSGRELE